MVELKEQVDLSGYLRLLPHMRLVLGGRRGCLYNLLNGAMYSMNNAVTDFLVQTLGINHEELTVSDALKKSANDKELIEIVYQLVNNGDAIILNEPYILKSARFGRSPKLKQIFSSKGLERIYLQITSLCNLNCIFCKPGYKMLRSTGCLRGLISDNTMTIEDWKEVLRQAYKAGAKTLIIYGGEPLLTIDCFSEVIIYAKYLGFKDMIIYTNGTLIQEYMDILYKLFNGVHAIFVIQWFSHTKKVHDCITQKSGSFEKMISGINKLKEYSFAVYIKYVITSLTINNFSNEINYLKSIKIPYHCDYIYSNKSMIGGSSELLNFASNPSMRFQKITCSIIQMYEEEHPCLSGQIAINSDGYAFPCPLMIGMKLGCVKSIPLGKIIALNETKKWWQLTPDKRLKCRDCEFRLGCFDCRAVQLSINDETDTQYCLYDPLSLKSFEEQLKERGF
ncbi:radical SAM protein [Thermoanaerobacterium thermosaccharolyticum]|uniref:Putative Fe-S oxidoreductase n=1 Tax=Thermoanaerobacterium thermosaccharolyticum M0795 TaxID=698948 RepID=L0IJ53_THETR|nr:radical SAM protein [Thermoanaerobacterium thermosaccharolyticum]AGB18863.1 putative Fe-S oxidoreductase [Thermoanaerobacterium thermosaccharolyticum M0795]